MNIANLNSANPEYVRDNLDVIEEVIEFARNGCSEKIVGISPVSRLLSCWFWNLEAESQRQYHYIHSLKSHWSAARKLLHMELQRYGSGTDDQSAREILQSIPILLLNENSFKDLFPPDSIIAFPPPPPENPSKPEISVTNRGEIDKERRDPSPGTEVLGFYVRDHKGILGWLDGHRLITSNEEYKKYIKQDKCEPPNEVHPAIFLCPEAIERVSNNTGIPLETLVAKIIIHELGHAYLDSNYLCFKIDESNEDFFRWMEESMANFITLLVFDAYDNGANHGGAIINDIISFVEGQPPEYSFALDLYRSTANLPDIFEIFLKWALEKDKVLSKTGEMKEWLDYVEQHDLGHRPFLPMVPLYRALF